MNKVGPRLPMTAGPLVAATGAALLSRIDASSNYVIDVLVPTTIFGAGVTLLVTPLTATVLGALPDNQAGAASGINNAVARTAGLLAIAAIPLVAGLGGDGLTDPARVREGFQTVAWWSAALLAAGGALAALTIRTPSRRPGDPAPASRVPRVHCGVSSPPAPSTVE